MSLLLRKEMSSAAFEEEETVGELITQYHVRDAIERLDFEDAGRISQFIQNQCDDNLEKDISEYALQQGLEYDNAEMKAQRDEIDIDIQTEKKMSMHVNEFNAKFQLLKQRQQQEMDNLKSSWEEQHSLSEKIARKKIDDLLHTSKVLATCECYNEAVTLRDNVKDNIDTFINNECAPIDNQFRRQFRAMNERHRAEMESLFSNMENGIQIIEGESRVGKSTIKAEQFVAESMSPVRTIINISQSGNYTQNQKKALINHFSPMKTPKSFSKMNSTLNKSQNSVSLNKRG